MQRLWMLPVLSSLVLAIGCQSWVSAQAPVVPGAPPAPAPVPPSPPEEPAAQSTWERLSRQTLGGGGMWGDELFFHDWHIQRNALTGHYRLLDGENVRHTWGTFEHCQTQLETIRRQRQLPDMQGKVVVLLHGLGGFPGTMSLVAEHLQRQGGYTIVNVSYPSTRGNLRQFAYSLARIIMHLDGVEEINLVGHSMGNLVIRYYLGLTADPNSGVPADPRLHRIVMIAPPNHGAELAGMLSENGLVRAVAGEAAMQLGPQWSEVADKLATPPCEFGILSGGLGDGAGYSSTLPGDDDGLVTLESTRLIGARDSLVLPHRHNLLLVSDEVQRLTLSFLENGYFRTADQRQPIE